MDIISSFLPQISCIKGWYRLLNMILPPQMSKMHEHAMSAGLWVAKRERPKAIIGDTNFFDAIICGLSAPKGAIIMRCLLVQPSLQQHFTTHLPWSELHVGYGFHTPGTCHSMERKVNRYDKKLSLHTMRKRE